MKLASFEVPTATGAVRRIGVLSGDRTLVDVAGGYARLLAESDERAPEETAQATVPTDTVAFLSRGDRAMEAAREVLSAATEIGELDDPKPGRQVRFDLNEVDLLASLPRPNSLRAFSVFEEHLEATFPHALPEVWYEMPIYWKGNPDTVVAPDDEVTFPAYAEKLDFEIEVCAVIGKYGRNVDAADAHEYIAGYTIHNDWSDRAIQMEEMEMSLGPAMGKDFANGFGPYLVTPDAFDVDGASYSVRVNGEVWTERTIGEMQHSFADMIEHVTKGQPILPGDAIVTGTLPGGCGLEHDRLLEPGDEVELRVDGLGSLRNTVGRQ